MNTGSCGVVCEGEQEGEEVGKIGRGFCILFQVQQEAIGRLADASGSAPSILILG